MAHAIADTFKSVAGSSVTTIAGFLALCVMTFALGRDMGIVMAKGVVIGVICCITTLPAMILVFDGVIEKQNINHWSKAWIRLLVLSQSITKYGFLFSW